MKNILLICFFYFLCIPLSAQSITVKDIEDASKELLTSGNPTMLHLYQELEENYPQMTDEQKAVFGLKYTEALDATQTPVADLKYLDFSIDYYARTNNKKKHVHALLYKGRHYKTQRNYPAAIQTFLKAKDQLNPSKDFNLLGNVYIELAHLAAYQDEFSKSLGYTNIAIENFEKSNYQVNLTASYVLKSWIYQTIGELDSAIISSKYVLEATPKLEQKGDALNDIGYAYYQKGNLDSAHYFIKRSLHYPYDHKNGAIRFYHQAQVYTDLYEYDSAKIYLRKALYDPIDIYTQNDCYKLLVRLSLMSGETDNLAWYIAQQQICADSIRKIEMQPNINTIEELHKTTKETEEARTQNTILAIVIIIIVVIAALILLFLHKQKKKVSDKADTYKVELEKKHETLLQELHYDFEKTREKYAEKRKKADFIQRQEIERTIYEEVLYIDDEQKFFSKMNAVLNHLPDKLKAEYPAITSKDIICCCLFVLDIPTQDIAMLMDYTQSSLYKFKQRLAKKLNLSGSKELEQMLREKAEI
ncbi:tetratricopeptide repeat protein [Dysgonomonas sp. 25]|uniref:tetratricopeptide repeat protein n=1 Tax=Dysgonomonas sp. 25 TaxID=2302933 RepID=UPI0013D77D5A|nr:hypothetical protein [Dysgonomonas sp. 25]NDV69842.1 hypothetical protein [Dysgonomonas sp. 25]